MKGPWAKAEGFENMPAGKFEERINEMFEEAKDMLKDVMS